MTTCLDRFRIGLVAIWLSGVAAVAQADQTIAELKPLFDALASASDASEASQIELQIWQHWLTAPDDNSAALMSQVVAAMQARQLTLGLKLSDQLIDSTPDFAEAWNKRATLHYLLGDIEASVDDIKQTVKLEPRHFGAISGLGLIFLKRGNYQNALDAFEQVLKISPQSQNTLRSIERVRNKLGDKI
ncbi:MAG: tetratricopeptide repeat protein [Granulosicoccaceae bacterium]